MKITKNRLRQIIKKSIQESFGIGPYAGVAWQTRKPKSFSDPLRDNKVLLKDALLFLKNMVLHWGIIEDGMLVTDPSRISNRYKNPRIKPDEWIRGPVDDPEIKWSANHDWEKLSSMSMGDWVRFRKWKPVQLGKNYGRNLYPYRG